MINTDKNTLTDEYATDPLFRVSDEEILETILSSDVIESAESARERVFERIAEKMGIENVSREQNDESETSFIVYNSIEYVIPEKTFSDGLEVTSLLKQTNNPALI